MGNYLSKFDNKVFTFHTPPITSEHLKTIVNGIQKSHVFCDCYTLKQWARKIYKKY